MDTISAEAVAGLNAALVALLPAVAAPALTPDVSIQLQTISPSGLGGFVGINDLPPGEIYGRKIDAIVVIGVKAAPNQIDAAVAAAGNALLAADRATLGTLGVQRITLDEAGETSALSATLVVRPVRFRVLYEFLKIPVDPEGLIQRIPLNIQLQQI